MAAASFDGSQPPSPHEDRRSPRCPSPLRGPMPVAGYAGSMRANTPGRGQRPGAACRGASPAAWRKNTNKEREQSFTEGAQVDYFSPSNQCWMPATISTVDQDTGAVQIDVKPGVDFDLKAQRLRLRPRTKPGPENHEWVRAVLREGRINEEARKLFQRYARPSTSGHVISAELLTGVAIEIDQLLGVSGSLCALKFQIQHFEDRVFNIDDFTAVFWELLWGSQREYGQALQREHCCPYRQENPHSVYTIGRVLGTGGHGKVQVAYHKQTGCKRAIKSIVKDPSLLGMLEIEIDLLRLVDHPNIVKLYEHFEDPAFHYLVMDCCSGGDLQAAVKQRVTCRSHFSEGFIVHVMRQVLMAISHVHAHGVVHLDLKCGNIMLMPERGTLPPALKEVDISEQASLSYTQKPMLRPHVMVIDLGVAQFFRPGDFRNKRPIGTPCTMAPEVWRGEFTPKADVFSMGTVMFELLSLKMPWTGVSAQVKEAVAYWDSRPSPPWDLVHSRSDNAVGLCGRMLLIDRHRRPAAAKCLRSHFISGQKHDDTAEAPPVPEDIAKRLSKAPERSILYKSVALAIARNWPSNQMPTIKKVFQDLDILGTGRLEKSQISGALEKLGINADHACEAADSMDLSRDGTVDWTEFVAASIHLGNDKLEEDLRRVFREVDADGDGLLVQDDIAELLAADHLRHGEAVRDVFTDLVGRGEDSARVDWRTFRQHFRTRASWEELDEPTVASPRGDDKGQAVVASAAPATTQTEHEDVGLFQQARFFLDVVRHAVTEPAPPPPPPPMGKIGEEKLRCLEEMGFSDRKLCLAVLRRHRNNVTASCIEELCQDGGPEPSTAAI
eukprot:TRINITY_DN55669_c0_g1_i1.p1 TRINITY_DN55669_c0_g1~~TRINITY_DN55669_c0_g1_i1.p1  ORF type:complete len:908 (-),score=174.88 TRINITY_DN55669_c0_g1_i1:57-2573(-)